MKLLFRALKDVQYSSTPVKVTVTKGIATIDVGEESSTWFLSAFGLEDAERIEMDIASFIWKNLKEEKAKPATG